MSDQFSMQFVDPDLSKAIFLERCEDQPDPAYIVTAKTKCMRCDQWCWLGNKSMSVVLSGGATPMCLPCGNELPNGVGTLIDVFHDRRK